MIVYKLKPDFLNDHHKRMSQRRKLTHNRTRWSTLDFDQMYLIPEAEIYEWGEYRSWETP